MWSAVWSLGLLTLPLAQGASWVPLGAALRHSSIVALSACIMEGGVPLLAYGASDTSPVDTTIHFVQYAAGAWAQLATHTPQFAQSYDHFDLRCIGPSLYLGLVIDSLSGLSSILKRVQAGSGEDGFEGCYAFESQVYDYAITPGGDVRMLSAAAANDTLGLSMYGREGWSTYPAGDAWGPSTAVDQAPSGWQLAGVRVAPTSSGRLFASYALDGATGGQARVRIGETTLENSTAWAPLGEPFSSASLLGCAPAELAWGASAGLLCAAAMATQGALVACASAGAAPWQAPVLALQAVLAPAGLALAAQDAGSSGTRFTIAALSADGSAVLAATCTVAPSGSPCAAWTPLPPLGLSDAANNFVLSASGNATLLAVSMGPADGSGDAVASFLLAA